MKSKTPDEVSEKKTPFVGKPPYKDEKSQAGNIFYIDNELNELSSKEKALNPATVRVKPNSLQQFTRISDLKSIEENQNDLHEVKFSQATERENLIRLFLKKGEYIYARPNDIVMVESCDHLVKVYMLRDDKVKKTIRCNTLKDFFAQLPEGHFIRIGRFCAINLRRLSGGDYNQQTFEFDFKVAIKLKHPISPAIFNNIGK